MFEPIELPIQLTQIEKFEQEFKTRVEDPVNALKSVSISFEADARLFQRQVDSLGEELPLLKTRLNLDNPHQQIADFKAEHKRHIMRIDGDLSSLKAKLDQSIEAIAFRPINLNADLAIDSNDVAELQSEVANLDLDSGLQIDQPDFKGLAIEVHPVVKPIEIPEFPDVSFEIIGDLSTPEVPRFDDQEFLVKGNFVAPEIPEFPNAYMEIIGVFEKPQNIDVPDVTYMVSPIVKSPEIEPVKDRVFDIKGYLDVPDIRQPEDQEFTTTEKLELEEIPERRTVSVVGIPDFADVEEALSLLSPQKIKFESDFNLESFVPDNLSRTVKLAADPTVLAQQMERLSSAELIVRGKILLNDEVLRDENLKVTVSVNDKALTKLNQHIDKKIRHIGELNNTRVDIDAEYLDLGIKDQIDQVKDLRKAVRGIGNVPKFSIRTTSAAQSSAIKGPKRGIIGSAIDAILSPFKIGFNTITSAFQSSMEDVAFNVADLASERVNARLNKIADQDFPLESRVSEVSSISPDRTLARDIAREIRNALKDTRIGVSPTITQPDLKIDHFEPLLAAVEAIAKSVEAIRRSSLADAKVPDTISKLPVEDIEADPGRFQFKVVHGKSGASGSLGDVKTFNEDLAGVVSVWKDPNDGKTYVVNGHNRLHLAKSLNVKDIAVRFLDEPNAEAARSKGALINIAENRGNAIDVAKFFRDSGTDAEGLKATGVPATQNLVNKGLDLSKLNPELFKKAIEGQLTIDRGAIIGGTIDLHELQDELFQLIVEEEKRGKKLSNSVLQQLAENFKASKAQTTLFDLGSFGGGSDDLLIEKAKIQDEILQQLKGDRKTFSTVGKDDAADKLKAASSTVDASAAAKIADEIDSVVKTFNQLKTQAGVVSDAVAEAARRLSEGDDIKAVKGDVIQSVFAELKSIVPNFNPADQTIEAISGKEVEQKIIVDAQSGSFFDDDLFQQGLNLGQDLEDGFTEGIKGDAPKDAISDTIRDVIDTARNELDSNSPSKEFIAIGQDMISGLILPILADTTAEAAVRDWISRLVAIAKPAINLDLGTSFEDPTLPLPPGNSDSVLPNTVPGPLDQGLEPKEDDIAGELSRTIGESNQSIAESIEKSIQSLKPSKGPGIVKQLATLPFRFPARLITDTLTGVGHDLGRQMAAGFSEKTKSRVMQAGGKAESYVSNRYSSLFETVSKSAGYDSMESAFEDVKRVASLLETPFDTDKLKGIANKYETRISEAIQDHVVNKTNLFKSLAKIFSDEMDVVQDELITASGRVASVGVKSLIAPLLRVNKDVQIAKAAQNLDTSNISVNPEILKRANETGSLSVYVPGNHGTGGKGNESIKYSLAQITPENSGLVGSRNFDLDADVQNRNFHRTVEAFDKYVSPLLQKIGVNIDAKSLETKIAQGNNFLPAKLLENQIIGSKDATYSAAVGKAYRDAGFQGEIKLIGYSAGAADAQEAVSILNKVGIDAKGASIGGLVSGLGLRPSENFTHVAGGRDWASKILTEGAFPKAFPVPETAQSFFKGFAPQHSANSVSVRDAGSLHNYRAYLGNQSVQEALATQGFLKNETFAKPLSKRPDIALKLEEFVRLFPTTLKNDQNQIGDGGIFEQLQKRIDETFSKKNLKSVPEGTRLEKEIDLIQTQRALIESYLQEKRNIDPQDYLALENFDLGLDKALDEFNAIGAQRGELYRENPRNAILPEQPPAIPVVERTQEPAGAIEKVEASIDLDPKGKIQGIIQELAPGIETVKKGFHSLAGATYKAADTLELAAFSMVPGAALVRQPLKAGIRGVAKHAAVPAAITAGALAVPGGEAAFNLASGGIGSILSPLTGGITASIDASVTGAITNAIPAVTRTISTAITSTGLPGAGVASGAIEFTGTAIQSTLAPITNALTTSTSTAINSIGQTFNTGAATILTAVGGGKAAQAALTTGGKATAAKTPEFVNLATHKVSEATNVVIKATGEKLSEATNQLIQLVPEQQRAQLAPIINKAQQYSASVTEYVRETAVPVFQQGIQQLDAALKSDEAKQIAFQAGEKSREFVDKSIEVFESVKTAAQSTNLGQIEELGKKTRTTLDSTVDSIEETLSQSIKALRLLSVKIPGQELANLGIDQLENIQGQLRKKFNAIADGIANGQVSAVSPDVVQGDIQRVQQVIDAKSKPLPELKAKDTPDIEIDIKEPIPVMAEIVNEEQINARKTTSGTFGAESPAFQVKKPSIPDLLPAVQAEDFSSMLPKVDGSINIITENFSDIKELQSKLISHISTVNREYKEALDPAQKAQKAIQVIAQSRQAKKTITQQVAGNREAGNITPKQQNVLFGGTKAFADQEKEARKYLTSLLSKYRKSGKDIGVFFEQGLAQGLANDADTTKKTEELAYSIIKAAKRVLRIKSPSGEGKDIGRDFDRGIAKGIEQGQSSSDAASEIAQDIIAKAQPDFSLARKAGELLVESLAIGLGDDAAFDAAEKMIQKIESVTTSAKQSATSKFAQGIQSKALDISLRSANQSPLYPIQEGKNNAIASTSSLQTFKPQRSITPARSITIPPRIAPIVLEPIKGIPLEDLHLERKKLATKLNALPKQDFGLDEIESDLRQVIQLTRELTGELIQLDSKAKKNEASIQQVRTLDFRDKDFKTEQITSLQNESTDITQTSDKKVQELLKAKSLIETLESKKISLINKSQTIQDIEQIDAEIARRGNLANAPDADINSIVSSKRGDDRRKDSLDQDLVQLKAEFKAKQEQREKIRKEYLQKKQQDTQAQPSTDSSSLIDKAKSKLNSLMDAAAQIAKGNPIPPLNVNGLNTVNKKLGFIGKTIGTIKNLALTAFSGFVGFQAFDTILRQGNQAKEVFKQFQSAQIGINLKAGGVEEGAEKIKFLREESDRLGARFLEAADNYSFLAGQVQGGEFESATDGLFSTLQETATALQFNTEKTHLLFKAFGQIFGKGGKLSAEEVRQQLGELGISADVFREALGFGKSELAEFNKQLDSGNLVITQQRLEAISDTMTKRFTGGLSEAMQSLQALENRFANAADEARIAFAQQALPAITSGLEIATGAMSFLANNSEVLLAALQAVATVGISFFSLKVLQLAGDMGLVQKGMSAFAKLFGLTLPANIKKSINSIKILEARNKIAIESAKANGSTVKLAASNLTLFGKKAQVAGMFVKSMATQIMQAAAPFLALNLAITLGTKLFEAWTAKADGARNATKELQETLKEIKDPEANLEIGAAAELKEAQSKRFNLSFDGGLLDPFAGFELTALSNKLKQAEYELQEFSEKASKTMIGAKLQIVSSEGVENIEDDRIRKIRGELAAAEQQAISFSRTADSVKLREQYKTLAKELSNVKDQFDRGEASAINLAEAAKNAATASASLESNQTFNLTVKDNLFNRLNPFGSFFSQQAEEEIGTAAELAKKQSKAFRLSFDDGLLDPFSGIEKSALSNKLKDAEKESRKFSKTTTEILKEAQDEISNSGGIENVEGDRFKQLKDGLAAAEQQATNFAKKADSQALRQQYIKLAEDIAKVKEQFEQGGEAAKSLAAAVADLKEFDRTFGTKNAKIELERVQSIANGSTDLEAQQLSVEATNKLLQERIVLLKDAVDAGNAKIDSNEFQQITGPERTKELEEQAKREEELYKAQTQIIDSTTKLRIDASKRIQSELQREFDIQAKLLELQKTQAQLAITNSFADKRVDSENVLIDSNDIETNADLDQVAQIRFDAEINTRANQINLDEIAFNEGRIEKELEINYLVEKRAQTIKNMQSFKVATADIPESDEDSIRAAQDTLSEFESKVAQSDLQIATAQKALRTEDIQFVTQHNDKIFALYVDRVKRETDVQRQSTEEAIHYSSLKEKAIAEGLEHTKIKTESLTKALDRQKQILESFESVRISIASLKTSTLDRQLNDIKSAEEIFSRLSNEESTLTENQTKKLKTVLEDLTGKKINLPDFEDDRTQALLDSQKIENDLLLSRQGIEDDIAKAKFEALNREIQMAQVLLAIDLKRQKITSDQAIRDAQQQQAQAQIGAIEATGSRQQAQLGLEEAQQTGTNIDVAKAELALDQAIITEILAQNQVAASGFAVQDAQLAAQDIEALTQNAIIASQLDSTSKIAQFFTEEKSREQNQLLERIDAGTKGIQAIKDAEGSKADIKKAEKESDRLLEADNKAISMEGLGKLGQLATRKIEEVFETIETLADRFNARFNQETELQVPDSVRDVANVPDIEGQFDRNFAPTQSGPKTAPSFKPSQEFLDSLKQPRPERQQFEPKTFKESLEKVSTEANPDAFRDALKDASRDSGADPFRGSLQDTSRASDVDFQKAVSQFTQAIAQPLANPNPIAPIRDIAEKVSSGFAGAAQLKKPDALDPFKIAIADSTEPLDQSPKIDTKASPSETGSIMGQKLDAVVKAIRETGEVKLKIINAKGIETEVSTEEGDSLGLNGG